MSPWLRRFSEPRWLWGAWLLSRAVGVVLLVVLSGSRYAVDKDLSVYAGWAAQLQDGSLPWRDFDVEYPPGIVPLLGLPGGSLLLYSVAFVACALAADAALQQLLRASGQRAALLWLLTPLALGPVVWARLDIFVALLLVLAVRAARTGSGYPIGAYLAGAALLKLWPAVVVLLWLPLLDGATRRRMVTAAAAAFALPVAVVCAWGGGAGLGRVLQFHAERGLEVEALAALPVHLGRLAGSGARVVYGHGSAELVGVGPWLVLTNVALLISLLLLAGWVWRARSVVAPEDVLIATVVLLLVFGKVLSPQYLVWLASSVALVLERLVKGRGRVLLVTAICLLATQAVFPLLIDHLVDGKVLGVVAVAARDAFLVLLSVLLVRSRARMRA